ncbi:MAG TPA: VOC family protein [Chloroflexota bacterium]|jgi:catechol 2,3-dioxygenase-like lactoylglutathione lyase family enzyme
MQIVFVAGFSPIVREPAASRAFYADALGITFEDTGGDYVFADKLSGCKHLGLWPLAEAAQSCFGTAEWPAAVPVPQATIEFEVPDAEAVAAAAGELEARGYQLIHPARTEPWMQTIARLLSPEGLLVGVCYTPALHAEPSAAG